MKYALNMAKLMNSSTLKTKLQKVPHGVMNNEAVDRYICQGHAGTNNVVCLAFCHYTDKKVSGKEGLEVHCLKCWCTY